MTVARSVARSVASPVARAVGAGIGGGLHTYFTDNQWEQPPTGWSDIADAYTESYSQVGYFGLASATQLIPKNNATNKRFQRTVSVAEAGWKAVRFYFKAVGSVDRVAIQEPGGGQCAAMFDLTGETATPFGTRPAAAAYITNLGGGWFECRAVRNFTASPTYAVMVTPFLTTWGAASQFLNNYAGDGVSGGLVDRLQMTEVKTSQAEAEAAL